MTVSPDTGLPQPESKRSKRRQQLWAFQRDIAERTQNARATVSSGSRRLAIQAGPEFLLLDLMQTGELLTHTRLTPVPLTKAWFLGLANCRGNLIGVVDLAGFLGLPVAAPDKNDRLLVLAAMISTHCAIRISRVIGLIDIASLSVQPSTANAWQFAGRIYTDQESKKWTELDLAAMARDPSFLDINHS